MENRDSHSDVKGAVEPSAQSRFTVEVAYALPENQVILPVEVGPGTTVRQAVQASGIAERFPEIDLEKNDVGIFGKLTKPDQPLRPKDRVEIYRPLIADPKEVRKQRAADGKVMRKGGASAEGEAEEDSA